MELDHVLIKGACEHNLKSVDVRIPKKQLVVLTGVSGSGKSSLAFDTLYAEGQRRYVESLSAYARQFLGRLDKPRYDSVRGLSPTISIEQKTTGTNPRSTVGTITELSDYLRVLYARVGRQHCHQCGRAVRGQSAEQIAAELVSDGAGATRLLLLAPLLVNRKGEQRDLLEQARRSGFVRLRIDGEVVRSEGIEALDKRRKHTIEAVVDRIALRPEARARITESVEAALRVGQGTLIAAYDERQASSGDGGRERVFSEKLACTRCSISFPELTPQGFSFNSPQGMCPECNGLGTRMEIDPELIVPNPALTIDEGAVAPWGDLAGLKQLKWDHGLKGQIFDPLSVRRDVPWKRLSKRIRRELLYGTGEELYRIDWQTGRRQGSFDMAWEGVIPTMMRRFRQTQSDWMRRHYSQYLGHALCSSCSGSRLRAESAAVQVGQHTLVDVSAMTVDGARKHFAELSLRGAAAQIAREALKEIRGRLEFLGAVGLGYLSLDRPGPSLSGGEAQRMRLASQLGTELTGVIYVLDEPSIGLHQRDNRRLLTTLRHLRDVGNTVVVVEHDEQTIRAADHVIDFGPGAGVAGGRIVHSGSPASLERQAKSLTGAYLTGRRQIDLPQIRREPQGSLELTGVAENNLQTIDVAIPLGVFTAVTGVSGAGKSTLVSDVLHPALARRLHGSSRRAGRHRALRGIEQIDKVIAVDQRPIGRTPRSNPATYIKVFDEIRAFFAKLPAARMRAYAPGRFSFNVRGGRCETCGGDGVRKVEMHFLPDVYVRCEQCRGRRFNQATLEVRYQGKSIADVLQLTVAEALELFANHPKIAAPLRLLDEVGVDYLPLGQPSPTLSGGEAQRIKLARELARRATGRTVYILDEPTTGLHFDDIRKLLGVLGQLVDAGNTVVVIEHNLDVIKTADHVIDLGPEGGPHGGHIVAEGTPEEVAATKGSHTGRHLKKLVRRPRKRSSKRRAAVARANR